jgi:hypothetical protein
LRPAVHPIDAYNIENQIAVGLLDRFAQIQACGAEHAGPSNMVKAQSFLTPG